MRQLITTDSHLVPPFWLTERLPAKWRDQFPRVETEGDGRFIVYPSSPEAADQMMITSGQRPSRVKVADEAEFVRINHANVCEEATPGFGPAERLVEMERGQGCGRCRSHRQCGGHLGVPRDRSRERLVPHRQRLGGRDLRGLHLHCFSPVSTFLC